MWLYMKFMVAFDSWILYRCLRLVNFPFSYWISTCLKKKSFSQTLFFLKSPLFCGITSSFWRVCLQTRLLYNFRFQIWNKIHDRYSLITNFIPDRWNLPTDNKRQHLVYSVYLVYLEYFAFDIWLYWPFNVAAIACFWYFNNNVLSVIISLAFDNDNVSLIQIFRLHT